MSNSSSNSSSASAVYEMATALVEVDSKLVVLCPLCSSIHQVDRLTTPRLIPIPAFCDPSLRYVIGDTMTPKSIVSAINIYNYEILRKREAYHRRKAKKEEAEAKAEAVAEAKKAEAVAKAKKAEEALEEARKALEEAKKTEEPPKKTRGRPKKVKE